MAFRLIPTRSLPHTDPSYPHVASLYHMDNEHASYHNKIPTPKPKQARTIRKPALMSHTATPEIIDIEINSGVPITTISHLSFSVSSSAKISTDSHPGAPVQPAPVVIHLGDSISTTSGTP